MENAPPREQITAILTCYRRPHSLEAQIAAVRAQTIPPLQVWAWVNDPDERMKNALNRVQLDRVVSSNVNAHCHSRFALALTAPTTFVALFDDDTIPGEEWFENCLHTMQQTPGILGAAGITLEGPSQMSVIAAGWHAPSHAPVLVDFVGHAWFLRTEWIRYLFADRPVTGRNGEDIELSARAWRLAGIASICPAHPRNDRRKWGSVRGAELGIDDVAMSANPAHLAERERIVKAEIAAGWQPQYLRAIDGQSECPQAVERSPRTDESDKVSQAIEARIPSTAKTVLDIGGDLPELAKVLSSRPDTRVVGLYFGGKSPDRTEHYHRIVSSSDETGIHDATQQTAFDCVVSGRILETARQPLDVLRQVRASLCSGGRFVTLVSNLRHHRSVNSLLHGRWRGQGWLSESTAGTTTRFYTRREIEKVFFRGGFDVHEIAALPNSEYEQWKRNERTGDLSIDGLHTSGLPVDDAEEFYVEKYLVSASPAPQPEYGKTTIIIPTHNQLSYTKSCIESIRYRTDEPYELIVIDNGSTDGTVEFLKRQTDVRLVENSENRGFPSACNQGIRLASGAQILLLNNDVIVTTGWLERMLRHLQNDPKVGLVGPCTNRISGSQQIDVSYADLASLDGFAWQRRKEHAGVSQATDRLVGFCLLFKRQLVEEVGLLDERFGIGNFEDDDYCRRAKQVGYRALIARDAFVHHFGSVTFQAAGHDYSELLRKNEELYRQKWRQPSVGSQSTDAVTSESPPCSPSYGVRMVESGGLLLESSEIRLSLCMIVRDSTATLAACLKSIRPWVDEMVIVDTGSEDGTSDLARRHGARVFHFPWCDDFSAARNESIKHARGKWVFWMDSDDTIDAENGRKLRDLVYSHDRNAAEEPWAFVMQVRCPGGDEEDPAAVTVVDHVKLFQNRPEIRFTQRIHEQVLPAIRQAGGSLAWSDVFVVHSGADHSPAGRRRKQQRDLRILNQELTEQPNHPFTLFNLGMTYADMDQHARAVPMLQRSIEAAGPDESHLRKAYSLLISSLSEIGEDEQALDVCRRGRELFPKDPELCFRSGVLAHREGRLDEARQAYMQALADGEERHFSSIDRGIVGYKCRHNLALVHSDAGDWSAAEQQWRAAIDEVADYRPGWRGLGDALLGQQRLDEARTVSDQLKRHPKLQVEGLVLAAKIAEHAGELAEAASLLKSAVKLRPDDPYVLDSQCRFLFLHGSLEDAQDALTRFISASPDDAAAHHNLGTVNLRMGKHEAAVTAYQRSVELRPDSAETLSELGFALKALGRLDEAISAWQVAQRICPENRRVAEELQIAQR